jgi:hypothetical protein
VENLHVLSNSCELGSGPNDVHTHLL